MTLLFLLPFICISFDKVSSLSLGENLWAIGQTDSNAIGGIMTVDSKIKSAFESGFKHITKDYYMLARGLAQAAGETSFGSNLPDEQDQRGAGKYGKLSQEHGMTRLSQATLQRLGAPWDHIAKMDLHHNLDGAWLSGLYAAKAMILAGSPDGYAILTQGGLGAFESWVSAGRKSIWSPNNGLNESEKKKISSFLIDYTTLTKVVLSESMGKNRVPWLAHGRQPQTIGENRIGQKGNVFRRF